MKRYDIFKYTLYVLEILLSFVIQTTPHLLPSIFGEKAFLLLPAVLSAAVFESEIPSVALGLTGGLLADLSYSGSVGFFSIFLVILCYTASRLMADYIRTSFLTVMLMAAVGTTGIFLLHFLFFYVLAGGTNISGFFAAHYMTRIGYTLICMPVYCILNKTVSEKFQRSKL